MRSTLRRGGVVTAGLERSDRCEDRCDVTAGRASDAGIVPRREDDGECDKREHESDDRESEELHLLCRTLGATGS